MYEAYIEHFYYLKKGEVKMKNEFKSGDLVFEIDARNGVELTTLSATIDDTFSIQGSIIFYLSDGRKGPYAAIPSLLHATPENRQALVTLYGEDAVPKLPVRGSELTKKLLEKQKYVLCWTAAQSDDIARRYEELAVIEFMDDREEWFVCVDGHGYNHAVPIDMNGNEITEIE